MLNKRKAGKLLILLLAVMLAVGAVPAMAENEAASGTFYLSLTDDAYFVESDGAISGVLIAHLPIKLENLVAIDLDEYGLGDYAYDPDGDGLNDITMLHAIVYLLENYYSGGAESLVASGSPGSFFMNSFWGHDCNLTYYVNGSYPLEEAGWGATADHILLEDGDFADISMITDWNFYSDSNAGHAYFGIDGEIMHSMTATAGEDVEIQHIRRWGNITSGGDSESVYDADVNVYYATEMYSEDAEMTWTDENGVATLNFPTDGTWYVWTEGMTGTTTDGVVCSPAYMKVTVGDETGTVTTPGDVDGNGAITIADAAKLYAAFNGKIEPTDAEFAAMDIDGNGTITIADAAKLYAAFNGKITLS